MIEQRNYSEIAEAFKETLLEIYGENLKKVILFGSIANGTQTGESDMDLLVILEHLESIEKESERILDAALSLENSQNIPFIISALPMAENDYLNRETPLILSVKREGVKI
ncbi:MAG: nucleotidyltransferase domain-containing protein [Candidatus Eremiobacteraeota bacterium]|nr:nucleotidyltransferase domain-containing protein [Candidatus Eremiobacteraeota bacterium]